MLDIARVTGVPETVVVFHNEVSVQPEVHGGAGHGLPIQPINTDAAPQRLAAVPVGR